MGTPTVSRRELALGALAALITPKGPTNMYELEYRNSGSVTLDGTGSGAVTFNGPASNTTLRLSSIVVSCSSSAPRPKVTAYRGLIAPHQVMGFTFLGDADTLVADPGDELKSGEALIVVWSGGAPGATARANVNGTEVRNA